MFKKSTLIGLVTAGLVAALALPAFAHDGPNSPKPSRPENFEGNSACMVAALDKREASFLASFHAYHNVLEAAMGARASAYHDAWSNADKDARKAALKAAQQDFRRAHVAAMEAFKNSKHSAKDVFHADVEACHAS